MADGKPKALQIDATSRREQQTGQVDLRDRLPGPTQNPMR
jgi:hypothetical protein